MLKCGASRCVNKLRILRIVSAVLPFAQNDKHCIRTTPTTNHNNHEPIENVIAFPLEPTPPSIAQTHDAAELVPSASTNRRPKRTIRPTSRADQAEINDNN